jgi:hypothetical protein
MKHPLLAVTLTIGSILGLATNAQALRPEDNPNCYRTQTQATIYDYRYTIPAFYCLNRDGTSSFVLDVSQHTSNFLAVKSANFPAAADKIFIKYQDGKTKDETRFWSRY